MYALLTKKDVVALNQEVGESGEFHNESSLDFALQAAKVKRNWVYGASYLVRSLLTDHVFRDGNKRTALLVAIYYTQKPRKLLTSVMEMNGSGVSALWVFGITKILREAAIKPRPLGLG